MYAKIVHPFPSRRCARYRCPLGCQPSSQAVGSWSAAADARPTYPSGSCARAASWGPAPIEADRRQRQLSGDPILRSNASPQRTPVIAWLARDSGSDPTGALTKVFDRVTGRAISSEELKTYAEVLAQYHLSWEDKFDNGQFLDRGRTERRHVVATGFIWIGKEANRIGESGEAYPVRSAVGEFI
jgi:hypothetical protein